MEGRPAAPAPPAAEPVQRWRLRFARQSVPAELVGRTAMDAWQETLAASALPVAGLEPGGPGRARFALGAPLPAVAAGRAELADIWLLERRPAWAIREALAPRMPPGHEYVAAENVWLGSPPLPGQIVAATWSVTVDLPASESERLEAAARSLVAARTLPRVRARTGGDRAYDLRPLLGALGVEPAPSSPGAVLRLGLTTRIDPALGAGRPEEVVAALSDQLGRPLDILAIVRTELVLAEPRRAAPSGTRPTGRPVSPRRRARR